MRVHGATMHGLRRHYPGRDRRHDVWRRRRAAVRTARRSAKYDPTMRLVVSLGSLSPVLLPLGTNPPDPSRWGTHAEAKAGKPALQPFRGPLVAPTCSPCSFYRLLFWTSIISFRFVRPNRPVASSERSRSGGDLMLTVPIQPCQTHAAEHFVAVKRLCQYIVCSKVQSLRPKPIIRKPRCDDHFRCTLEPTYRV